MKKNVLTMMAAALLCAGLAACGGKNGTSAETTTDVGSVDNEIAEEVKQVDLYAYMIPDSTGVFGMLPVHTFYASWEQQENSKNQQKNVKIRKRLKGFLTEDFKNITDKTIPTEVAKGVDVTIAKPFKPTSLNDNENSFNIDVTLKVTGVFNFNNPSYKDSIMLVGYDNENHVIWTSGKSLDSGILDNDNRVFGYFMFKSENSGYLSRLAKIVVVKKDKDYWNMNESANGTFSKACRDFQNVLKERKREFAFNFADDETE